jgi:anthranilate synthase component 1
MEIIEELETTRRGIYGGAVTAFGFDGNMDSAITIRSAVLKAKGKRATSTSSTGSPQAGSGQVTAYVQAGAGLVADSVPESEFMESCNKARVVLMAIDQAEKATAKPNSTAKTRRTTKSPKRKKTNLPKSVRGGKKP